MGDQGRGRRNTSRATPDDQRIDSDRATTRLGSRTLGQGPQPGHAARKGLHHRGQARDPRKQVMVIDSVGEKPVGDAQQIGGTRPPDILGFHAAPLGGEGQARHHVGDPVDAHQATVAAATQAPRSSRAVELGAPRQRQLVGGDQRLGERFPSFGLERLAIEGKRDRITERRDARCRHRRRRLFEVCYPRRHEEISLHGL